ncbi:MAG: efflux RND transporter periplasmic adaptor subunit [Porticoccus sp.]|nr:efflux RND transporter periplasmic adaptor subunit [Porticoccus sp.]
MKRRKPQYLILTVSVTILVGVLFFNHQLLQGQTDDKPQPAPKKIILPDVNVTAVKSAEYAVKISGFGEAKTHFTLSLKAQNSGQIVRIAENFESGCRVAKDTVLVQIKDTDYLSEVAGVKSEVATARLELLEEQREASQAQAEWRASGLSGDPDSALVLHEPQLEAAQASVTKAEASLASAEKNLSLTRITAPFDAIVVERLTAPGSYVQAGTEVATLYSTDLVEIAVPLSTRDWSNLPDSKTLNNSRWPVQLTGVENGQTWQGRILRAQQHVDEASRQRTLFVAVDSPLDQEQPLLPGTFVKAGITGRTLDNVWKLRSSSLSQRGEIWYLSDKDTLSKFATKPLFSDGNSIYIEVPEEFTATSTRIVDHPLSSYLSGMKVHPVLENDNA